MRQVNAWLLFFVVLLTASANQDLTENFIKEIIDFLRDKRAFGYRTICTPKRVKLCQNFTYGRATKQFCFFFRETDCTSLDKKRELDVGGLD